MRSVVLGLVSLLVAFGCGPGGRRTGPPPSAISPPMPDGEKRCLRIARIDRTQIVDDQTLLFHMRNGDIWRNRLPQKCYGIRMQGGFGYATSLDVVCDLDILQVLGGSRSVCGLGRFELYEPPDETEANAYDAAPYSGEAPQ